MKFKNWLILMLFISAMSQSDALYAQQAKDIIGKWKVIKVGLAPTATKEEKEKIDMVAAIFSKIVFYFQADSSFKLDAPDKDLATQNGVWVFDETKKKITVTERNYKGARGKLMDILVKLVNSKYVFMMDETPLVLTVEKVRTSNPAK